MKIGLLSDFYCDEQKRLYLDGTEVMEYNKETRVVKSVFSIPESNYTMTIGKMDQLDVTVLICENPSKNTEVYFLDNKYELIRKLELTNSLYLKCIGNTEIILIDEHNKILRIDQNGNMETSSLISLSEYETILGEIGRAHV